MTEFTETQIKEYINKALKAQTGDNLERAELEFSNRDLTEKHWHSGQTRGEILEGYRKERRLYHTAKDALIRAGLYTKE